MNNLPYGFSCRWQSLFVTYKVKTLELELLSEYDLRWIYTTLAGNFHRWSTTCGGFTQPLPSEMIKSLGIAQAVYRNLTAGFL
jgi:hypothetical protein